MLQELEKSRAWIEVNLDNLKYNIMEIKQAISKYTKIIAVVKANFCLAPNLRETSPTGCDVICGCFLSIFH